MIAEPLIGRQIIIDGRPENRWVPPELEEEALARCAELSQETPYKWILSIDRAEMPEDARVVNYVGQGTVAFASVPLATYKAGRA